MSDENKDLMDEEISYDIITLLDEEGDEHEFELVDEAEIAGVEYVALIPIHGDPQELLDDSGELVVMRVTEEDGEQFLDNIKDEDEYNKVCDIFMERLEDIFDFDETEED